MGDSTDRLREIAEEFSDPYHVDEVEGLIRRAMGEKQMSEHQAMCSACADGRSCRDHKTGVFQMNPEWLTMGVGDGGGKLFVYGDYDSIKAAQKKLIEKENYLQALELLATGKVANPAEFAKRAMEGNTFIYSCMYCGKHYNSLDSFSRRDTSYACTECEWKGKPQ